MTDIVITAAGCVTARGCGSHRSPFRPWGGPPGAAVEEDGPPAFTWSSLFATPCPRFGRMDRLCQLGLAAVELMGVDFTGQTPREREDTAVCLGTPDGSIRVDAAFWSGRGGVGGPDPALFAYTLPSTLIGEICIRYGLKGPNLCFMLGAPESGRLVREASDCLRGGEAAGCLCVFANAVDRAASALATVPAGGIRDRSFAYALYLERVDDAGRLGHPALARAPEDGGDVRALCNTNIQSVSGLTK